MYDFIIMAHMHVCTAFSDSWSDFASLHSCASVRNHVYEYITMCAIMYVEIIANDA